MRKHLILAVTIASLTPLHAVEETPLLAMPSRQIYEHPLGTAPDGWTAMHGAWRAIDGALRGAERAEDNHGAVLKKVMGLQDCIFEFEVRMDGAKGTSLSINDAKGHLARVSLSPGSARLSKDDHDKEGPDEAVLLGTMKLVGEAGAWHTVRLEIVGQEMLAKVDGDIAFGSHEQLKEAKANFAFTVSGETASFRNLKIWEATPNPDWKKVQSKMERERARAQRSERPERGSSRRPRSR